MEHKLLYYPNELLNQKSEQHTIINDELISLVDEMKKIMLDNKGMGLSGTQVGSSKRVFIMKEVRSGDIKVFVNPKVVEKSQEVQFLDEGCLSFPSIFVQVMRPKSIEFTAQDLTGEERYYVVEGLEATCVLHEMDHLEGENFLSKTTRQQRKAALAKMK